MNTPVAEFWLDIGGTFTDCIVRRASGELARHKVLSSGATKGTVGAGSAPACILDDLRRRDPPGFWTGYEFRLIGPRGEPVYRTRVANFDQGRQALALATAIPAAVGLSQGQAYELVSGEEAPIVAIRYLLGLPLDAPLPSVAVRLGTTRGTNALLTRRGARTALVMTRGFGDVVAIGGQNRPKLFELDIRKPAPLYEAVVEIDERIAADGAVLQSPDFDRVARQLREAKAQGIESLAICLLHGSAWPQHELAIEQAAREVGFVEVSVSHRVAPLVKIVSRGDTTVVDAYLNPVLRAYVQSLRTVLGAGELRMMTSAGGLVSAESFTGKDSILSGPAGGVVGFSRVAQGAGFNRAIGFDMGGTSTDVARFDGRFELEYEAEKAGVRVATPMMAIETVAAGGGSICGFDGVKLVVGPDSAGADPGPACYGRGGPLAITDVNFFLGKIPAERFPFALDLLAVESRLDALVERIAAAASKRYGRHELCQGFLQVANAKMARAIQAVSLAKGCDPREYALVAFGGAAGQHACAVARELGMRHVLSHPDAGVLSALGMGLADVARHAVEGVYQPYSAAAISELDGRFARLADRTRQQVLAEGIPAERISMRRSLDLRYRGVDACLTVPAPETGAFAEAYEAEHERLYGYRQTGREIEIVAARVEAVGRASQEAPPSQRAPPRKTAPHATVEVWFDGAPRTTGVFDRDRLAPGDCLTGPAIVCEALATTAIDPGWRAEALSGGELLFTDEDRPARPAISTEADPVMLEVFNNQFAAIAEQMGIALRNTSSSVNVKERLDFSCAVFTRDGDLVVNAPHIPVHLGAMGETVRHVIADNPDMRAGDVFVTNDPYRGGSHLPDVTVVTPVFGAADEPLFFTASRAHHAEIGGIRPGSMPPFSTNLAQEGVLIRNFKLVAAGVSHLDELRRLLTEAPYPSRSVADNVADVTAQVAANRQGARDLARLVERYSLPVVQAYMEHIQGAAERKMRAALVRLPRGTSRFEEHLDDGSPIVVSLTLRGDAAEIDFAGTGPVLAGNLNANRAIVTAAAMYCFRCLIDEDIPLNQGVLTPLTVRLPECLLNPPAGPTPETSAAIVGGNVETSQRVVDALLGALGLAAASQGTMNNLLFGDATFGYYETICGGAGATRRAPGASAVHTHMTNTRLTDVEVLERRYPVRVREFSIRRGSGGAGVHRGGDGIVRRLEFLREVEVSIVSQRRGPYAPYGLDGGQPGALGNNSLARANGAVEELPGIVQFTAYPGDVLTVQTPGGGGCGRLAGSARRD